MHEAVTVGSKKLVIKVGRRGLAEQPVCAFLPYRFKKINKSIMANASWGNLHTCRVLLSDYDDGLILFCIPLENMGLGVNELAIESACWLSRSI